MTTPRSFTPPARRLTGTMFLILALFFGPLAASYQAAQADNSRKLLRLHNKERKKRNRKRLRSSGALNRSAQKYAAVMASNKHFSHTGPAPEFSRLERRILAEKFRKYPFAENIARGQRSASQVTREWMRSPGHRRNILHRSLRSIGFGKANGSGGPYWVADFGG